MEAPRPRVGRAGGGLGGAGRPGGRPRPGRAAATWSPAELAPWAAPKELVLVDACPGPPRARSAGPTSPDAGRPTRSAGRPAQRQRRRWRMHDGPAVDHQGVAGDPRGGVRAAGTGRRRRCPRARPSRRRGSRRPICSSPVSHSARANSVLTSPGAMALTRTRGPSSPASWRVRWITAALVTLYQPMPGSTVEPADRGHVEDRPAVVGHAGPPGGLGPLQVAAAG